MKLKCCLYRKEVNTFKPFRIAQKNTLYGRMNKVILGSLSLKYRYRISETLTWIAALASLNAGLGWDAVVKCLTIQAVV